MYCTLVMALPITRLNDRYYPTFFVMTNNAGGKYYYTINIDIPPNRWYYGVRPFDASNFITPTTPRDAAMLTAVLYPAGTT